MQTKNKTVSIIVPVYNVKEYLEECVQSILAQTYKDIQIILVDDGSTDGSEKICDSLAERNECICTIHQKNSGVSAARNEGIKHINGAFIFFVDADDYINPKAVESFVSVIEEENAQAALCGFNEISKGSIKTVNPYKKKCLTTDEAIESLAVGGYQLTLWNKFFRVENIKINDEISPFLTNLTIGEDMYWLIENLLHCSKIACTPYIGYSYRIGRPGSAVSKGKKSNWLAACTSRKEASFKTYELLKKQNKKISWFFYKRYLFSLKDIMCMSYLENKKELTEKYRNDLANDLKKYENMNIGKGEKLFILKCKILSLLTKVKIPNRIFEFAMKL